MPTVRAARAADLESMVEMQRAMALETEELSLDRDVLSKGVAAVLADPAKGRYWIAEDKGAPIGMMLTIPEWSDWRNGTVWWIHSLYVLPAHRGAGAFRALHAHLRASVEADPAQRGIRLYVDHRNRAAQKIYEGYGMSAEHYKLYEWLKA